MTEDKTKPDRNSCLTTDRLDEVMVEITEWALFIPCWWGSLLLHQAKPSRRITLTHNPLSPLTLECPVWGELSSSEPFSNRIPQTLLSFLPSSCPDLEVPTSLVLTIESLTPKFPNLHEFLILTLTASKRCSFQPSLLHLDSSLWLFLLCFPVHTLPLPVHSHLSKVIRCIWQTWNENTVWREQWRDGMGSMKWDTAHRTQCYQLTCEWPWLGFKIWFLRITGENLLFLTNMRFLQSEGLWV